MQTIFIYVLPLTIIAAGIYLSFFTDAIKDISILTSKPYSFARAQLMWWTIIILSCFSVLYGWKQVIPDLDGTLLAILGIGAGTTALANLIDQKDIHTPGLVRHQDILVKNGQSSPSKGGFLYDILDDGKGISVHRFQALIFNVVLGIIFIHQFFHANKMPRFTEYELGLLGISSTAYLAVKAKEN